jgi:hypothetical protein
MLKMNRRFRGTFNLHLTPKGRLIFKGLRGILSQKIELISLYNITSVSAVADEYAECKQRVFKLSTSMALHVFYLLIIFKGT